MCRINQMYIIQFAIVVWVVWYLLTCNRRSDYSIIYQFRIYAIYSYLTCVLSMHNSKMHIVQDTCGKDEINVHCIMLEALTHITSICCHSINCFVNILYDIICFEFSCCGDVHKVKWLRNYVTLHGSNRLLI